LFYSGRPESENTSREGVGILLDKEAKRSLIEWQPILAKIIVARLKTNIRNIVIYSVMHLLKSYISLKSRSSMCSSAIHLRNRRKRTLS